MEIRWWQGGLHITPSDDAERTALATLVSCLDLVQVGHQVHSGPVVAVEAHNEEPIVSVHEPPDVVP